MLLDIGGSRDSLAGSYIIFKASSRLPPRPGSPLMLSNINLIDSTGEVSQVNTQLETFPYTQSPVERLAKVWSLLSSQLKMILTGGSHWAGTMPAICLKIPPIRPSTAGLEIQGFHYKKSFSHNSELFLTISCGPLKSNLSLSLHSEQVRLLKTC